MTTGETIIAFLLVAALAAWTEHRRMRGERERTAARANTDPLIQIKPAKSDCEAHFTFFMPADSEDIMTMGVARGNHSSAPGKRLATTNEIVNLFGILATGHHTYDRHSLQATAVPTQVPCEPSAPQGHHGEAGQR